MSPFRLWSTPAVPILNCGLFLPNFKSLLSHCWLLLAQTSSLSGTVRFEFFLSLLFHLWRETPGSAQGLLLPILQGVLYVRGGGWGSSTTLICGVCGCLSPTCGVGWCARVMWCQTPTWFKIIGPDHGALFLQKFQQSHIHMLKLREKQSHLSVEKMEMKCAWKHLQMQNCFSNIHTLAITIINHTTGVIFKNMNSLLAGGKS